MEQGPKGGGPEQPYETHRGGYYIAYEKNGKRLLVNHALGSRMKDPHPVATYGNETTAEMDGRAFDILFRACGGNTPAFDKERFERYLDAIIAFETQYSDNEERHRNRLPIEEEILDIMKGGGYFDL